MPAGGSRQPASHETVDQRLHYVKQDGQAVFKFAVRNTEEACRRILERNKLSAEEIDLFVSHQANRRIILSAAEKLGVPEEKVVINIERFGNTTAATIPLALNDAVDDKRLKRGDLLLMVSVGAGFTVGVVAAEVGAQGVRGRSHSIGHAGTSVERSCRMTADPITIPTDRRQRHPEGRRPRGAADQPAQAVLAGAGHHQGRTAPVLRRRRAGAAAAHPRPRDGDAALSQRRRRRVVLHEGGADAAAAVDPHLPDRPRRRQGGELPGDRRPAVAALARQPRVHRSNQWYARCDDVDRPDYLHFDLDPGEGATFEQVRSAASSSATR